MGLLPQPKPLPFPPKKPSTKKEKQKHSPPSSSSSSWDQFKNLLTCKQVEGSRVHNPSKPDPGEISGPPTRPSKVAVARASCRNICTLNDVVHAGRTRVVHRSDNSPESSSVQETRIRTRKPGHGSSGRSGTTSSKGMPPLRKLSGCYECRMIVDPSRYPIVPRAIACCCPQCGEIFHKVESLEQHLAVTHAVSELGPEDSGRSIVEIIFKSSWLKKGGSGSVCKIERILKVHNTQRTIQRFEECREAVKLRAGAKKNPRCAADGNELLRFHCAGLACALGSRGSSSLCGSVPGCGVCTVIRQGFQGSKGVRTTASSGRAHDCLETSDGRRAMLVCRVIAGRVVRHSPNDPPPPPEELPEAAAGSYDSVAGNGGSGVYADLEELVVFNPRAILPCFVVVYKTLDVI